MYGVQALALKLDGCDAADLKALIDRALHAAVTRKILHGERVTSGKALYLKNNRDSKSCLACHLCEIYSAHLSYGGCR